MHPPATQCILYSIDCQPEGREGTQSLYVAKVGWELQGDSTQSTVLYQCQAPEFSRHCLSSRKIKVGISPSKGTGHTSSFGGLDSCLSHHFLFVLQLLCAITGYKLADTSAKSAHHSSSQPKHRSCLKFPRGTCVSRWDGCCHVSDSGPAWGRLDFRWACRGSGCEQTGLGGSVWITRSRLEPAPVQWLR